MTTRGATASNNNDDAFIQLASSIKQKLCSESPLSSRCCIFQVPKTLRRHNNNVYETHTISIGPFHHGKKALKSSEKIKLWYLHDLLSRALIPNTFLEDMIKHIKELEVRAGACTHQQAVPWVRLAIQNDLLLFENQLHWFVLECLFNLTTDHERRIPSLADLALNFFHDMILITVPPKPNSKFETKHLLDLVCTSLVSPNAEMEQECPQVVLIPSVTELLQSRVKFKVGNPKDILGAKFSNGVLEIPPIKLQENAESIFRNLIAFEQCDHECTHSITSLAILLDNLINSSKDVDFRSNKGIIEKALSNEDICLFFNRLYNDAVVVSFSYHRLSRELIE
ncbi:hypothetical protein HHK36_029318 [Tetracentron sinense]|uniref:Uncharacterized protein n=1 Tax=Tetracentron sinense TaxID=13715 RepID=A0A834YDT3_TETSI|nr:hypothetical protein HHK36_029318 [Tetracentron sinense]